MGRDSLYPGESAYLAAQATAVIAEVLGVDESTIDPDLGKLHIDSLTMLDVLAALEARFHVVLNENMIRELRTIYDIARIVKESIRTS